jgi:hypothetical protein
VLRLLVPFLHRACSRGGHFSTKPASVLDPILVTGVPNAADFVFVNYLGPNSLRIGYDS